ncbi:hypothetical protein H8356DRAFT_926256, partial [Neocallimastix lanati (nom. inval.)]
HFILISCLSIKSITFTRSSTTSSTGTLTCLSLRNRDDNERIHTQFWIISTLFYKPWINNIVNTINSNTSFSNIGSNNDFTSTRWSRFKNF